MPRLHRSDGYDLRDERSSDEDRLRIAGKSQDTFIWAGASFDWYSTMPDMASTQAK